MLMKTSGLGWVAASHASYSPAWASSAVCHSERMGSRSENPMICQFSRILYIMSDYKGIKECSVREGG